MASSTGGGLRPLLLALAIPGLLLGAPDGGAGQEEETLPTLRGLGLSYLSSDGRVQVDFSGRMDLELYLPGEDPAWLIPETDPFAAGRIRLFTDVFVGERFYGVVEGRLDRGEEPEAGSIQARIQQAFVRLGPFGDAGVALQVGRIVSPFGGYPRRHHTVDDPFIRPPFPYEYRTVVSSMQAPPDAGTFVTWKDEAGEFRPRGAPPIWGAPYPWGALVLIGSRDLGLVAGAVNSAPSSEPEEWGLGGTFSRPPSWVARGGVQAAPELRLEASYSRGPYFQEEVSGTLPPGWSPSDYLQEIWGVEGIFSRGRLVVRGEAFADRWEVPNVLDDAWDFSYTVEARLRSAGGLYGAARFGAIHFNRVGVPEGEVPPGYSGRAGPGIRWDHDARRLQLAAGYRIFRNAGVRAEYLLSRTSGPVDPSDSLLSLQLWWGF